MPSVRSKDKQVIAITCSDLHLSHKPPIWRSAEDDWYDAMHRPLKELSNLAVRHNAPIICAGDIFDDGWRINKCPPELINFAIKSLPSGMVCIPGQHDLPHHRYEDIGKSAYWTLVEAKKIENIDYLIPKTINNIRLWGFPWGKEIRSCKAPHDLCTEIAIIHSYIWTKDWKYPGAPKEKKLGAYLDVLEGYDIAVFGDNHKGFVLPKSDDRCAVINNGTFLRRKSDEKRYEPFIGLIYSDGSVDKHKLNTSEDKYIEDDQMLETLLEQNNTEDLLEELLKLGDAALDFGEAIERFMSDNKVSNDVRSLILKAME